MALKIGHLGPSFGWLMAKVLPPTLQDCEYIVDHLECDAAEIVWHSNRVKAIMGVSTLRKQLRHFSLHLPPIKLDANYPMRKIGLAHQTHKFDVAPLHPPNFVDQIMYVLPNSNIPIAIENMDRTKQVCRTATEVSAFTAAYRVNKFVFDTQHIFEVQQDLGAGMDFALNLAHFMVEVGEIVELHVSGEITEGDEQKLNHAQLHEATNAGDIIAITRAVLELIAEKTGAAVPIIFEGEYLRSRLESESQPPSSDEERTSILDQAISDMDRERSFFLREIVK